MDTDLNQILRDDEKILKSTEDMVMTKRIGKPDEQAGAVVYFLSDYATCEPLKNLDPEQNQVLTVSRYDWDGVAS